MSYFTPTQKLRLARSLFSKRSPAYVQYYVTARCNLACEQCNIIYSNADVQEMRIDQIRAMAENLAEIGTAIVLLIGGEPFVRKDLAEIVAAFCDVGIHVRLQTNGLASERRLEECVNAGAHDISISLDSLSGALQDQINGGYKKSWERAVSSIAAVNKVFPNSGTAFFGTVLMPRNLLHIREVIEFGQAVGWGTSLVPVHHADPGQPRGFRTFDDDGACQFRESVFPLVREVIDDVKSMKREGYPVYDSVAYLDDIYRFIVGEPVRWRSRNQGVCDSPDLYFAIEPNGNLAPCCDFKIDEDVRVYDLDFARRYRDGTIHSMVEPFVRSCDGCMYGSYPEVSISARYFVVALQRLLHFERESKGVLKRVSAAELIDLAIDIHERNVAWRERHDEEAVG